MTNIIECLLGARMGSGHHHAARTGGPSSTPPGQSVARIKLSFNIVAETFAELMYSIDGDPSDKGIIVVDKGEKEKAVRRTLYTRLHNYLSAIYSYHEQVKTLINEHAGGRHEIEDSAISPHKDHSPPHDYIAELAYIYGLRHGLQHGEYGFLNFREDGDYADGDFTFHELKFSVPDFESASSVKYAKNYTAFLQTPSYDHNRPLVYIYNFNDFFGDFHEDVVDWINGDP